MTREEALAKAQALILEHSNSVQELSDSPGHDPARALFSGLRIVRERLLMGTCRTNDLTQLAACAIDVIRDALIEAETTGEKPLRPSEILQ